MSKKFWQATFTLTGAVVGAGILGLPYVFSKSGFLVGLLWIAIISIIMTYVNLSLGEVTLRTKGNHQLVGYARKYLGKKSENLMLFGMLFGIYSALVAYLIGEGESFSALFGGSISPVYFAIIFWMIMTFLLTKGIRGLKKVESYGVIAIIIIIIGIFIWSTPNLQISNLNQINNEHFILPIGVVLFSLLGFVSIPEIRQVIKGEEKNFKKSIIYGLLISSFLYILFSASFVGILGSNVSEVATISLGPITSLLGIFTMLTSYFVLSYSLKDLYKFDMRYKRQKNFFLTSLLPLIIYLIIHFTNIASFTLILGLGGVISGGLTGIMIVIMNKKAKKYGSIKNPKIKVPNSWPLILIFSTVFILGMILEIFY